MGPAVEVSRTNPVSEGIYHDEECKGNWGGIVLGRWGICWAISSGAPLPACTCLGCATIRKKIGEIKVGNTYNGGYLSRDAELP